MREEKNETDHRSDPISRREFIRKTTILTGGLAAAAALPDIFGQGRAYAAQVDSNDPGLSNSAVKFSSTDGRSESAYLSRPKAAGKYPAVIVIHEWRGLNDHIRDVARRLAKAGYVALVPDLLSREGGTSSFATPELATESLLKISDDLFVNDLTGAVNYLKRQDFVQADKLGVIGFCWGGGKALMFTTRSHDLKAAVIYYGENPERLSDVKNITAPVLGQYGEADERITSGVPKLKEAMQEYGKSFEYRIYPGAPHAFNNDTSPRSYRPEAAKEAWTRTLAFFKQHLQS
jgi:carboxymethylenebutenolidase